MGSAGSRQLVQAVCAVAARLSEGVIHLSWRGITNLPRLLLIRFANAPSTFSMGMIAAFLARTSTVYHPGDAFCHGLLRA